mgnify:CR=1 FL=1
MCNSYILMVSTNSLSENLLLLVYHTCALDLEEQRSSSRTSLFESAHHPSIHTQDGNHAKMYRLKLSLLLERAGMTALVAVLSSNEPERRSSA